VPATMKMTRSNGNWRSTTGKIVRGSLVGP